jgi:hypothetical protein
MEPMWQQNDDPNTFAAPQSFSDAVELNVELETLQFVSNQQNQLDNHISRQLADNGLVDSSTTLDTEDRQDIMLDTDESFAFEDDEVIMDASANAFDVDDSDHLLQFTDRLRGQHTAKEIMSLKLLKLLRLTGAPHYAYTSIMNIFADALASKIVTAGATFRQRDTAIMSQHPLKNAPYNSKLDICRNPRGIHGMTPGEPLHVVDLGLFKYGLEGFFICLGMNPKSKAPCKILMELDSIARRIGRFLSHQSDCELPRTHFPFGVTAGTKLSGHEFQGDLLVVLIM